MEKKEFKIISVGGSIVIPKTGFNIKFLKKFRELILNEVKKGIRVILVVGGGDICRQYQKAANEVIKLSHNDLDWIGIHATLYNAQFMRALFKDYAYGKVIQSPNKKVNTKKPIIIAAGNKPGHSTDTDAVLIAKTYGAKEVMNLSNIEYVYDKDPNKLKNAKKIEQIDWTSFRREIVGYKWIPGKNVPFDPYASRIAEELGLKVLILNGTDLKQVKNALEGKKFKGTLVL